MPPSSLLRPIRHHSSFIRHHSSAIIHPPSAIIHHPSTILVTGGSGFIGSNLVRLLVKEKGCTVVNLDKLTYAGNAESLSDLDGNPNYTFEQVDLCDAAKVTAIFEQYQPDAVMHLAAESHVDRSIDGPGEFIQTNVVGTFNLLQAALGYWKSLPAASELSGGGPAAVEGLSEGGARTTQPFDNSTPAAGASEPDQPSQIIHHSSPTKSDFRFLHVSTDEVYGSLAPDAPGFSETTPYDPHSPYSASKAASDHLARAWSDTYGLPLLVTNCSNNYGPYQFPEKLIPLMIDKALNGEALPIYGDGKNVRDWLYVEDHCRAIEAVIAKGRLGEVYNVGGNEERQNIEIVDILCDLLDELQPIDKERKSLKTYVKDRPGHDRRYAIDASKLANELGWTPQETFESGIKKTIEWYLNNQTWCDRVKDGSYKGQRLGQNTAQA